MKIKTIHYQICGLDYIYVQAPVLKDDDGEEYIDMPMNVIEKAIAIKLIEARVPLRGREVTLLRKTLKMSLKEWAAEFDLTAAGVLRWEKDGNNRLSKVNEAVVRSLVAERLGISISGSWSALVAKADTPKRLSLKIDEAA